MWTNVTAKVSLKWGSRWLRTFLISDTIYTCFGVNFIGVLGGNGRKVNHIQKMTKFALAYFKRSNILNWHDREFIRNKFVD